MAMIGKKAEMMIAIPCGMPATRGVGVAVWSMVFVPGRRFLAFWP
jgi:hypothetical protein